MGKRGRRRYYLRCKLYANSGTKKQCTRYSIWLIQLVSQRTQNYIGAYFHLEERKLPPPKDDHWELLLMEQRTLSAQLAKRSTALKNLYLDKVSGVLSEG